jgi:hypothetical protein
MPDQNQSDPNKNPVSPPGFSPAADLPPIPPAFQSVPSDNAGAPPPIPPVNQTTEDSAGSAAPPGTPPVISTPKKKFGGGKIIATILGILLLVGGIGAGILLTQQPQLFQQKASGNCTCKLNVSSTTTISGTCIGTGTTCSCPSGFSVVTNNCQPQNVTHKYKCSGSSCIQDDTGGSYTSSDCNGNCAASTVRYKCSGSSCIRDDVGGSYVTSNCNNSCSSSSSTNNCPAPASCMAGVSCAAVFMETTTGTSCADSNLHCCKPPTNTTSCTTSGTYQCVGNIRQKCVSGSWQTDTNCQDQGKVCTAGNCITPFTPDCEGASTAGQTCTGGTDCHCQLGDACTSLKCEPDQHASCDNQGRSWCKNMYYNSTSNSNHGYTCCATGYVCDAPVGCKPGPSTPSGSNPPAGPTAQCIDVKAYSGANWVLLNAEGYSHILPGDVVNFCVNGSTTAGVFDRAQFKVNAILKPETTTKRPGSEDYCQAYTIQDGDINVPFTVKAKIHHATLNAWYGETI